MHNLDELVPNEYPGHPWDGRFYRTLNLLRLFDRDGDPVYFVLDGIADPADNELDPLDCSYFYDHHSCPTNYVAVEAIMTRDEDDPHGIFEYVCTRWMPKNYRDNPDRKGILRALFPEIGGSPVIDGEVLPARRLMAPA